GDNAGSGSTDLTSLSRIRFRMRSLRDAQRPVADVYFARLAVQLEVECTRTVGMWLARGEIFDDQRFARLNFDGDFIAGFEAVEKSECRKNADIRVGLAEFVEFREDFGIEQPAKQVIFRNGMASFLFKRFSFHPKLHGRKFRAGPAF